MRPNVTTDPKKTPRAPFVHKSFGRYKNVVWLLRKLGRVNFSKEEQEDIAHSLNQIDNYGFGFIPNHYVMDEVVRLERFALARLEELGIEVDYRTGVR